MRIRLDSCPLLFCLLLLLGCGAKVKSGESDHPQGATGGMAPTGEVPAAGGTNEIAGSEVASSVGGGGFNPVGASGSNFDGGGGSNSGGASDAAADAGSPCDDPPRDLAPGPEVVDPNALGLGACKGKTMGDVLQAIRALRPGLADITTIYNRAIPTSDGSFIYPFSMADGGFAFAFKRGGGDCPAGCTENEYWYFETDSACAVAQVGHIKLPADGNCFPSDQRPMWGRPGSLDPTAYCDADASTQNVSGTYSLFLCGQRSACAFGGNDTVDAVTIKATMIIEEYGGQFAGLGRVTFVGTGLPELDGAAINADFVRRSFIGNFTESNLPSKCPSERNIGISYDFERVGPSRLHLTLSDTPDCSKPDSYCKGFLEASLGPVLTR